jgi:hypothetical protein
MHSINSLKRDLGIRDVGMRDLGINGGLSGKNGFALLPIALA